MCKGNNTLIRQSLRYYKLLRHFNPIIHRPTLLNIKLKKIELTTLWLKMGNQWTTEPEVFHQLLRYIDGILEKGISSFLHPKWKWWRPTDMGEDEKENPVDDVECPIRGWGPWIGWRIDVTKFKTFISMTHSTAPTIETRITWQN